MEARMILAIDTCGTTGTLALAQVDEYVTVVVTEAALAGRTNSSFLIPSISQILKDGAVRLDELAAIAVVHGPGSFTGVRIGVAAAKALAEASGKPLIAISRLDVLCRMAKLEGPCCGLLDAGRGEFYAGVYDAGKCIREELMTWEEVEEATTSATLAAAEPAVIAAFPRARLVIVDMPSATDALHIAAARLLLKSYDDAATLDGNYLRRTGELFAGARPRTIRVPAR